LTIVLLTPVMVVTGFFAIEVLLGLRPARTAADACDARAAIVIPAHNEAKIIGETVRSTLAAANGALVLVVADNCTDETLQEAERAGAAVLVRNNDELRGKGFALAAARDRLRDDPPDVAVILDADSTLDRRSLRALVAAASASMRPGQAIYLFRPEPEAPPLVQLSSFAFMIKNLVRQRGLQRLAGRAHLTGTGMAFPWPLFEQSDLGGSNIVEDLVIGLELADRGAAPMLVEEATVWSAAASAGETLVQRSRWEGGYLQTALRTAPSLMMRSLKRGDVAGICAALDLSIPPLALLVVLNAGLLAVALAAHALGGALWPAIVQLAVGAVAFLALFVAWLNEGRPFASGSTLLRLPFYILWKLPMYLRFVRHGAPKQWVRTGR
jgi:cellulose synthase/poly-beta-1,6-N-acetylglucosamine synthase-like glycosyltransferase